MAHIQSVLQQCNPFIRIYQTARQTLDHQENNPDFCVRIHFDPTVDQCRYNAPTANEIAAVLPGPGDEQNDGRDIILCLRGGGLQRIKYGSPGYLPLHYTLLYPNGDLGWHWDMSLRGSGQTEDDGGEPDEDRRLTAHRYHAYRIHYRDWNNGLLFFGGRLFQQYLVDV
jgi:hypothetical protein